MQRSRHLYDYGAPKTESADRWVYLFPQSVRLLAAIQPLHITPEMPVFTTTTGTPIEPKAFSRHWYDCLRALRIRQRGLYTTKDSFVTTALNAGVKIAWLEQQTGVAYATPRRHYGKWMPAESDSELRRFADVDPGLFCVHSDPEWTHLRKSRTRSQAAKCEEGDLNQAGRPKSQGNRGRR